VPPDPPLGHAQLTSSQLLISLAAVVIGLAYLWGVVVPEELSHVSEGFGPMRHWDLETYFLPKFVFGSEEILRGSFPFWNRFEFGGIPFLATAQPSAAYIPKILIFALWSPEVALRLFMIGHFVLLALFFLLFVRDQGIGGFGAFAGTLFCTFNIPFLSTTGHPMEIANLAWVPLIFMIGDRLGRSPSIALVAGLAAVVGIQVTSGYPEFVMDCGVLLALHAVVRYVAGDWKDPPWKTIPLIGAGFLLGAMVGGIQVFPLLDFVLYTGRLEIAADMASQFDPSGLFSVDVSVIAALVGVPALLAFACLGVRRPGGAPLVGALTCAFMLFGGWWLLRKVPGFAAVRMGGTWPLLIQFFIAWLVALGADRFLASTGADRVGSVGQVFVGGLGLVWAIGCLAGLLPQMPGSGLAARVFSFPTEGRVLLVSILGAMGGLLLATCAFGTPRLRDSRLLAMGAVGLMLLGQVASFPFGRALGQLAPPKSAHRSAKLIPEADLRKGRVISLIDVRGGFNILDRVESPFGREGSLPPPRFTKMEKELGVVVQLARVQWEKLALHRGLLATLDARFLVMPRRHSGLFNEPGFRNTGLGDGGIAVLEVENPLGRAWGVYGVMLADSPDSAFELLLSPGFDPRRHAILETSPRRKYPTHAGGPPTPARVRYLKPTLTEVEVEMREPGVLVLADSCFPGWEATVDGHVAEVLCANYLVRGVELEEGRHLVRFEYRPASVRWGAASSGVAGVAVAAILLQAGWRARRVRVPGGSE